MIKFSYPILQFAFEASLILFILSIIGLIVYFIIYQIHEWW